MLAQLEEVEGVREVRVDWTGRCFMFRLDRSAGAEAVVAAVAKVLGPTTQRLAPVEEVEQLSTYIAGAPWLRSGETARMSAHEAQVLATRYAADAAKTTGLDDERAARITALVQAELESLFKKFEVTGLPSREQMVTEWSDLVDRIAERSRGFLSDDETASFARAMRESFSR